MLVLVFLLRRIFVNIFLYSSDYLRLKTRKVKFFLNRFTVSTFKNTRKKGKVFIRKKSR